MITVIVSLLFVTIFRLIQYNQHFASLWACVVLAKVPSVLGKNVQEYLLCMQKKYCDMEAVSISHQGHNHVLKDEGTTSFPPPFASPFPVPLSSFLLFSSLFSSCPCPLHSSHLSIISPSPPFLLPKATRDLGECWKFPKRVRAESGRQTVLAMLWPNKKAICETNLSDRFWYGIWLVCVHCQKLEGAKPLVDPGFKKLRGTGPLLSRWLLRLFHTSQPCGLESATDYASSSSSYSWSAS